MGRNRIAKSVYGMVVSLEWLIIPTLRLFWVPNIIFNLANQVGDSFLAR